MKKFFRLLMIILIIIILVVLIIYTAGAATSLAGAAATFFNTIGFTSVTASSFVAANFFAIMVAGVMLCYNLSKGDQNVAATFDPSDSGGVLLSSTGVSDKDSILDDKKVASNRYVDDKGSSSGTTRDPIYDANGRIVGYRNTKVVNKDAVVIVSLLVIITIAIFS